LINIRNVDQKKYREALKKGKISIEI